MNFLASFLSALKPRYDDDAIDRLNYYYSCLIILILSITISAKQYVGQPIQCWVPAQFTGAWEQYAENYCFVQNTYWLPLRHVIPENVYERHDREIGYYQWVPFILALEALIFYMPCVFWRLLNWQSGIDIQSVVQMATETRNFKQENRDKAVRNIARHIQDAIELQHQLGKGDAPFRQLLLSMGKTKGLYVTMLYILTKLLYMANAVGQFFLLNTFLSTGHNLWGLQILSELVQGIEWQESGHFPRVTLCDFEVRVLGNIHRYTIQCVLMINMFNEKIFLFLWWWFVLVAAATVVSLCYWLSTSLTNHKRHEFIYRYLSACDAYRLNRPSDRRYVDKFVAHVLKPDGVFAIRMIAYNAGDIMATEVVEELWKGFKETHRTDLPFDKPFKKHQKSEKLANLPADSGLVELLYPVSRSRSTTKVVQNDAALP